jgi:hypothetical protein
LTRSYSWKESLPSQSSLVEPWLPAGMFRELNTPVLDQEQNASSSILDLNVESFVPDLEAHSMNLKATPNKAVASKFKFKKLKKKVENYEECDISKQDDITQESLIEDLQAPRFQTEYIGKPVVTIVIIVTFPLDFVSTIKTHVYACKCTIFQYTKMLKKESRSCSLYNFSIFNLFPNIKMVVRSK